VTNMAPFLIPLYHTTSNLPPHLSLHLRRWTVQVITLIRPILGSPIKIKLPLRQPGFSTRKINYQPHKLTRHFLSGRPLFFMMMVLLETIKTFIVPLMPQELEVSNGNHSHYFIIKRIQATVLLGHLGWMMNMWYGLETHKHLSRR